MLSGFAGGTNAPWALSNDCSSYTWRITPGEAGLSERGADYRLTRWGGGGLSHGLCVHAVRWEVLLVCWIGNTAPQERVDAAATEDRVSFGRQRADVRICENNQA